MRRKERFSSENDPKWAHLSPQGRETPTLAEKIELETERRAKHRAHMGTAYMKKLRELARHPEGTQFSQLTREMLTSESWKALCHFPNAMKVVFRLIEEHMAHAGAANGDLICTYNDFEAFGISRRSIRKAITIAEQLGFIDVLRGRRANAGYDRLPSRYRLTFEPTGEGEPRTNRWASRECIEIARKLQDGRHKRAARFSRHAR
jgi:hypothetical protein